MNKLCRRTIPIWDEEAGFITALRRGVDERPISAKELKEKQERKEVYLDTNNRPFICRNNVRCHDEITVNNINNFYLKKKIRF